jgi:hypothetical protein
VTSNGSRYKEKLIQLERVLAVLLFKCRDETSDQSLEIYNLVALTGIAVPSADLQEIRDFLESESQPLALIHQLYLLGRFAVYQKKMVKGGDDFLDSLSESSAVTETGFG